MIENLKHHTERTLAKSVLRYMVMKKVNVIYCEAITFALVLLMISQVGIGMPITTPFNQYIQAQDKICTSSYVDNQISYRKIVAKLFGLPGNGMFSSLKPPKEYTGFKLIKKHYIKNAFTGILSHISFNYCEHGKLLWNKDFPISLAQLYDFDWDKPICVYYRSSLQDKIVSSSFDINFTNATNVKKHNETKQLKTMLAQTRKSVKGPLKFQSMEKQELPSLKSLALNDPENFFCFKYARRKKYANSDLNVFFPQQWVGGLFYCDLNVEEKVNFLMSNMDSDLNSINQNLVHNTCSFANAIPMLPVIADQYNNYWTDYEGFKTTTKKRNKKEAHFEMVKNVPYLYTPQMTNIFDLKTKGTLEYNETSNIDEYHFQKKMPPSFLPNWKFKALDYFRKTPFMAQAEKWFNDISVTESYKYNQSDMNGLEYFAQLTLTKLQKMAKAETFDESAVWSMNEDHLSKNKMLKLHKFAISKYLTLEDFLVGLISSKLFKQDSEELQLAAESLQVDDQKNFDY